MHRCEQGVELVQKRVAPVRETSSDPSPSGSQEFWHHFLVSLALFADRLPLPGRQDHKSKPQGGPSLVRFVCRMFQTVLVFGSTNAGFQKRSSKRSGMSAERSWHEILFQITNFSRKMPRKFPDMLRPFVLWDQKIPPSFLAKKQEKFT